MEQNDYKSDFSIILVKRGWMVHKKYTYKNGKRFGPYYYENKRVNGKIVTRYIGLAPKKNSHAFLGYVILGILLLFALYQLVGELSFFSPEFEHLAIFFGKFDEGNLITGIASVKLHEGELLPKSTLVLSNMDGILKRRNLSDLIDLEAWKKIQDKFASVINIPIQTLDNEGNVIHQSKDLPFFQ